MKWRLIEQNVYPAAMNMAIDHAIYESVANGRENPTIRFYKWANNSVSIGAYQNPKEINLDACKKYNVEVVRRMTGGRAVFHDRSDFTYSVIAPIRSFNYSINTAYREICSWIIGALKQLGIEGNLEDKNDILVNGKKISGNAAKAMDKGIYLQHGTLVYDIDFTMMPEILNVSIDLINQNVVSVSALNKSRQDEVYVALENKFTKGKDFRKEVLSKFELLRAQDLAKTKYSVITLASSLLRNRGVCYIERGA